MEQKRREPFVVCIGRQVGRGGRALGKMLAERWGIDYYDKELLAEAARKAGMATEVFEDADEKMPNLMGSGLSFSMGFGQLGWYNASAMMNESIFGALSDVIHHMADNGPCVIVGRTADYVLRDSKVPMVSLFVHAPMEERVRRILARADKTTEKEAHSLAEKTDRKRAEYYNFYTDKRWGDSPTYDLSFDSSKISLEDICDLLELYIMRRYGLQVKKA